MQENKVVNADSTNQTEEVKTQEDVNTTPKAGDKTEPNLLLKSVQEERERRRLAEEKAALLEKEIETLKNSSAFSNDEFSDEGKAIIKLIEEKTKPLAEKLTLTEQERTMNEVLTLYPVLKDKREEFEAFRTSPDNQGMSLKAAARVYLAENGAVEPVRQGLEKPTGGDKTAATTSGMTADEVADLRKNNYRKYQEMVSKGLITIKS